MSVWEELKSIYNSVGQITYIQTLGEVDYRPAAVEEELRGDKSQVLASPTLWPGRTSNMLSMWDLAFSAQPAFSLMLHLSTTLSEPGWLEEEGWKPTWILPAVEKH